MKILVVEPKKKPYVTEIDSTEEALGKFLGGHLNIFGPFDWSATQLAYNDDSKAKGLPLNRVLVYDGGYEMIPLYGNFCLFNFSVAEMSMVDITDAQIQHYTKLFEGTNLAILGIGAFGLVDRKIKTMIIEESKIPYTKAITRPYDKPYKKEIEFNLESIRTIVGDYPILIGDIDNDEYVVIRNYTSDGPGLLGESPSELEFFKWCEYWNCTYIVCKTNGSGGIKSFKDDEIEKYEHDFGLAQMEDMVLASIGKPVRY